MKKCSYFMYQIYIAFFVGDYLCHDTKIGQGKVISRRVNYFHICSKKPRGL